MDPIFSPVFPNSTLLISILEITLLLFGLLMYTVDRDKCNYRFIILVFYFLQYNLVNGFLPNWEYNWVGNINWSVFMQNILAYTSGIVLAGYYFYFLTVQFDIQVGKIFNVKFLIISLFTAFILLYCVPYILTFDKNFARNMFIAIPSIIALYFALNTTRFILQGRKLAIDSYQKAISVFGSLGIIFMATMPIVIIWGDQNKGLNHLLVNIALLLTFSSHLLQFIKHNQRFHEKNKNKNKYLTLKNRMTKREIEVMTFVAKNKSVKEISELMFVSPATVRKHLSNTYEKGELKQKQFGEFMDKYPKISSYFSEV